MDIKEDEEWVVGVGVQFLQTGREPDFKKVVLENSYITPNYVLPFYF